MKNYVHARRRYLLLIVTLTALTANTPYILRAQTYAQAVVPVQRTARTSANFQDSDQKRSVRDILFALEEAYHVSFNYDDGIIKGRTLQEDFLWKTDEKLTDILDRLVNSAHLKFEKTEGNNYLVLPEKRETKTRKENESASVTQQPAAIQPVSQETVQRPVVSRSALAAFIVSGVVKDETSTTLPGVNVLLKGTSIGTTTDADGHYTLELPDGEGILVYTFIGYKPQEIAVANQTNIDVSLDPDVQSLQEVVVIGYGEQKRANVLGAVADVKPDDIKDFPVANLGTALVNRVPGVSISQASGKPGASTSIQIRNPVTFGGVNSTTDPLYVIDGFQVTKTDFDNLDATQVESIVFLKDAAASIYGSRGANGVVLVKTKRGTPGRAKISYQGSYALTDATRFSDMLSGYDQARLLNGLYSTNGSPAPNLYTPEELDYLKTHNYNWLSDTWQKSHLMRHTLNINGGNDQITYFAGASYYDETGNLRDLYVKKYTVRLGMNAKITENLSASVSLSTDNSNTNRPSPKGVTVQSETLSETLSSLMLMPGWTPMYIDNKPVYSSVPGWHPFELQNSGSYARSKTQGMIVNANLEYKIPAIKGLSARVQYAKSIRSNSGKEYYVPYSLYDFKRDGVHTGTGVVTQNVMFTDQVNSVINIKNGNFITENFGNTNSYQLNESITYARRFGNHDLNVLLVAEQIEGNDESMSGVRNIQIVPGFDQFFAYSGDKNNYDLTNNASQYGRMSYLGRLNYSFKDRYLMEATYRADASPTFPKNSQWGYFPSVALGWKVSEENFFRDNVNFLNDFKIRAQVGLIGRDAVTGFQFKERYTPTTGMLFGSTLTSGLNNNAVPYPQITWEKALYKNIGFDGTFLQRKFNFSIDLYKRHMYDMFDPPTAAVPTTFGGNIATQNHGIVDAWGIEAMIGYTGKANEIEYSVSMNGTYTDNKVKREFVSDGDKGTWRDPNGRRTDDGIEGLQSLGIVRTQEDLNAFLAANPGYTINGLVPKVGWELFKDQDGDGKIVSDPLKDKIRLKTRSGNRVALGYNLGVGWRGLKLSANIAMLLGGYTTYDKPARTAPTATQSALSFWKDAYNADNTNGKYPALDAAYGAEVYDLWIVSATTIRVNNMSLAYSLPSAISSKLKIPGIRVLLTGTNLWDIVNHQPYKYSGTSLSTDYPAMRTYTLALNLTM